MAVPKKKTSKSKRNMRRAHDAIKPMSISIDKVTGEYKLPHHVCKLDGMYNGKKMVVKAAKPVLDTEASE